MTLSAIPYLNTLFFRYFGSIYMQKRDFFMIKKKKKKRFSFTLFMNSARNSSFFFLQNAKIFNEIFFNL